MILNKMASIGLDFRLLLGMSKVNINLMLSKTKGNVPFYGEMVNQFYSNAQRSHSRCRVIKNYAKGIALCLLSENFDEFFKEIDATIRQDCEKALRSGYTFQKINYNYFLSDIKEIHQSADRRREKLSEEFLKADLKECKNPLSLTNIHDYPYFGVLKDGKLCSYLGCFIAGEICLIEHIFEHAEHHSEGVMPFLIMETARHVLNAYPKVRFYGCGTYFGASESLKRFKRHVCFFPYQVNWLLDDQTKKDFSGLILQNDKVTLSIPRFLRYQLVYRLEKERLFCVDHYEKADFCFLRTTKDFFGNHRVFLPLVKNLGARETLKIVLKLLTRKRFFYCLTDAKHLIHYGWITANRCNKYWIDPNSVVIGPIETDKNFQGKGLGTYCLKKAINCILKLGFQAVYIDTSSDNISAQKVFRKCGFGEPVAVYIREKRVAS